MQGSIKIEAGEKKVADVTMKKKKKKIHRKDRGTGEQERLTEKENGIHDLKGGIRKAGMAEEKREQGREIMDKNTLLSTSCSEVVIY